MSDLIQTQVAVNEAQARKTDAEAELALAHAAKMRAETQIMLAAANGGTT